MPGLPTPMRMTNRLLLLSLPVLLCTAQAGVAALPPTVVGEWRGIDGPEHLIFRADGLVRTCFGPNTQGNAAMGGWTALTPGRYRISFTHAISPGCDASPRLIRKYQVEILGVATMTANGNGLSLFVSGEGPPDRYARVAAGAAAGTNPAGAAAASGSTPK